MAVTGLPQGLLSGIKVSGSCPTLGQGQPQRVEVSEDDVISDPVHAGMLSAHQVGSQDDLHVRVPADGGWAERYRIATGHATLLVEDVDLLRLERSIHRAPSAS
jgi:hypothetical protein